MLFAADKYFTKSSLYKVLIINFFIKFIKSFVLVLFELFFSVIISSGLKRWFYEENTEKFLGIFPYGQNLVKMHRKDGQWSNTNRNYTENGFMMKKTLTKGRKL